MVREVRTKRLKVNVTESLRTRFWQRVERRGVDDCLAMESVSEKRLWRDQARRKSAVRSCRCVLPDGQKKPAQ